MIHKPLRTSSGFTITEVLVTTILGAMFLLLAYGIGNSVISDFFGLQRSGMIAGKVSMQSERVAKVIRSTTEIVSASDSELALTAFFSPNDHAVSRVVYKLIDDTPKSKKLLAEVTPYDANPPIGVLQPDKTRKYIISDAYLPSAEVPLFRYYNGDGNLMVTSVLDIQAIKAIQVNIHIPGVSGKPVTSTINAQLRNRKTNL